jgi:uncharacterized membrane protein YfcA
VNGHHVPVDPGAVAFVVAVVLLASTAQTLAGFGMALIAVPLLASVFEVRDTVVIVSLASQLNSTLVAVATRGHVPRRTVATMLAASFACMPIGLAVLLLAPVDALRIAVGVTSIVMAAAIAFGVEFGGKGRGGEVAAGAVSGVLSTSTGMNGPPVVLYLQHRGLPPAEFRAALSAFFLVSGAVSLAIFAASGVVERDALLLAVAAVPAVLAGNAAGHALFGRVSADAFRTIVLLLLAGTSVVAVASAVARVVV